MDRRPAGIMQHPLQPGKEVQRIAQAEHRIAHAPQPAAQPAPLLTHDVPSRLAPLT